MKKLIMIFAILMVFVTIFQLTGNRSIYSSPSPLYPQNVSTDKGIGPFQNVTLAPLDKEKAKQGLSLFTNKCALCHELDMNKVGPPLRNALKNFPPEFILNMMVNPLEMQKNNATTKELLKKYNNVPMPDQKISQQDALNIYEYLRSVQK